jgi:hypothetical protein
MTHTRNIALSVLIIFGMVNPVYSNYPSYNKIDPILKKTWDELYPLPYKSIKKKNTNGKGILVYKKGKDTFYIYTFLIIMEKYERIEKSVRPTSESREVLIKLYYNPNDKQQPYKIVFGELDEEYEKPGFVRYVN